MPTSKTIPQQVKAKKNRTKYETINLKSLVNMSEKVKTLTKEQLLVKLKGSFDRNDKHNPVTLDNKVLMLKILQYNGMDFHQTVKEVKVDRKTLMVWAQKYGDAVFYRKPESAMVAKLEVDILSVRQETEKDAFAVVRKGLNKLEKIIDATNTPRHIYAIAEAIRTSGAVIEMIQKSIKDDQQPVQNNFFTNILNNLNTPQNGNESTPAGDYQKFIQP